MKNENYEVKKKLSSESDANIFQKNLVCESDGFSKYMGVNSPLFFLYERLNFEKKVLKIT